MTAVLATVDFRRTAQQLVHDLADLVGLDADEPAELARAATLVRVVAHDALWPTHPRDWAGLLRDYLTDLAHTDAVGVEDRHDPRDVLVTVTRVLWPNISGGDGDAATWRNSPRGIRWADLVETFGDWQAALADLGPHPSDPDVYARAGYADEWIDRLLTSDGTQP